VLISSGAHADMCGQCDVPYCRVKVQANCLDTLIAEVRVQVMSLWEMCLGGETHFI
jgi:hypothetical protein